MIRKRINRYCCGELGADTGINGSCFLRPVLMHIALPMITLNDNAKAAIGYTIVSVWSNTGRQIAETKGARDVPPKVYNICASTKAIDNSIHTGRDRHRTISKPATAQPDKYSSIRFGLTAQSLLGEII